MANISQQKERLKRELAALEQKEKKLKEKEATKNIKLIASEILKYDDPRFDNLTKIIGLLAYFDYKKDNVKEGIMEWAMREISERKDKRVGRTYKKESEN